MAKAVEKWPEWLLNDEQFCALGALVIRDLILDV